MNLLDGIIMAVIAISTITAYYKGFLYTAYRLISTVMSIYLSNLWYRPIKDILGKTFLYGSLQQLAMRNVGEIKNVMGLNEQTRFIDNTNMAIPGIIKDGLIRNNNPEIYKLLGANNFEEYMGGYIANFYLSIITFIILLAIIKAVLSLVGGSIHMLSKLPVIGFADRLIGLVVGAIRGFIIIWISSLLTALLVAIPKFHGLSGQLSQSILGKWFYENNMLLDIINQLFT